MPYLQLVTNVTFQPQELYMLQIRAELEFASQLRYFDEELDELEKTALK